MVFPIDIREAYPSMVTRSRVSQAKGGHLRLNQARGESYGGRKGAWRPSLRPHLRASEREGIPLQLKEILITWATEINEAKDLECGWSATVTPIQNLIQKYGGVAAFCRLTDREGRSPLPRGTKAYNGVPYRKVQEWWAGKYAPPEWTFESLRLSILYRIERANR